MQKLAVFELYAETAIKVARGLSFRDMSFAYERRGHRFRTRLVNFCD
jgi:hypothetical protein